jgi:hypothetical protein
VHLQGRPLLGYEGSERWVLDPDTLISERPDRPRNDDDDDVAEVGTVEDQEPEASSDESVRS